MESQVWSSDGLPRMAGRPGRVMESPGRNPPPPSMYEMAIDCDVKPEVAFGLCCCDFVRDLLDREHIALATLRKRV